MSRRFVSQLSGVWSGFRDFAAEHKRTGWFTVFVILASWGVLASRGDIGVDTEIMLSFPEVMLKSWCGIGRWGLVFTKRFLEFGQFSQSAAVIASMGALWLLCMTVNFAVYQWSGGDERYGFFYPVFSAVYATSPCLAEQFYFLLQSFEVIWGILMAAAAVYAAGRYVYWRESPVWLAVSAVCGVWALGSYQAMACVFIGLSAFSFLLVYQRGGTGREPGGKWKWFRCGVSFVAVFLVMLAGYMAVSAAVQRFMGEDSSYIGDMILWKREEARLCLYYIKKDMQDIYFGRKVFYSALGLPVLMLGTALFLGRGWKCGEKERILYVMAGGFFIFSPTCITILTGFYQGVRVQMAYPFVLALGCGVLTTAGGRGKAGESGREERQAGIWRIAWGEQAGTAAAVCLCAVVAWGQWITSQRLLDTMHMVSEQDIRKCEAVYREAQALAAESGQDIRDKSLVFVGIQESELSPASLRGDMIGHSVFQWDADGIVGVSERVGNLMRALGLSHEKASQQQYEEGKTRASSMPCWPVEGSVALEGDMIIIKLSEQVS